MHIRRQLRLYNFEYGSKFNNVIKNYTCLMYKSNELKKETILY